MSGAALIAATKYDIVCVCVCVCVCDCVGGCGWDCMGEGVGGWDSPDCCHKV